MFAPYAEGRLVEAYRRLREWLAERGTDALDVAIVGMSLDDPSITRVERCRYDMGAAFAPPGGGGRDPGAGGGSFRDAAARDVAQMECAGDTAEVGKTWQHVYRVWLPRGDGEPADEPVMEVSVKLPEEVGWERFDLRACIPVERC